MASGFELQYPAGGSYTTFWLPTPAPLLSGPPMKEVSGIFGELMADGQTQYGYRISDAFSIFQYRFSGLTNTERLALISFQATVGAGTFDFKEGPCGVITAYKKVSFHPDNFEREWTRVKDGTHFATTIVLIEAP